jgi:hypothetical protein
MYTAACDDLDDICSIIKDNVDEVMILSPQRDDANEQTEDEETELIPTTVREVVHPRRKKESKVRRAASFKFDLHNPAVVSMKNFQTFTAHFNRAVNIEIHDMVSKKIYCKIDE